MRMWTNVEEYELHEDSSRRKISEKESVVGRVQKRSWIASYMNHVYDFEQLLNNRGTPLRFAK